MAFLSPQFLMASPKDSLRLEIRNGKKYIKHRVEARETIGVLAARYGVEELSIRDANPLVSQDVFKGQVLYIPINTDKFGNPDVQAVLPSIKSSDASAMASSPDNSQKVSEKVEPQKNDPVLTQVMPEKNEPKVEIKPTQSENSIVSTPKTQSNPVMTESTPVKPTNPIVVKEKEPIQVATVKPVSNANPQVIIQEPQVDQPLQKTIKSIRSKKGQTVLGLADKYKVDPTEFMELNNFNSNYIKAGTIIKIPVMEAATPMYVSKPEQPIKNQKIAQTQTSNYIAPDAVNVSKQSYKDDTLSDVNLLVKEKASVYDNQNGKREVYNDMGHLAVQQQAIKSIKVKKGQTIISIADKYNVSAMEIMELNNLDHNYVKPGTIIRIPVSTETIAQASENNKNVKTELADISYIKDENGNNIQVIIDKDVTRVKHDILKRGADKERVVTRAYEGQFMEFPINRGTIDPIPDSKLEEMKPIPFSNNHIKVEKGFHNVNEGETLSSIAAKYHINVSDIINWNNLMYPDNVHPGMDLIVSAQVASKKHNALNHITDHDLNLTRNISQDIIIEDHNEKGLCELNTSMSFTGILHASAPVGTMIILENKENFKRQVATVTGKLESTSNENVVLVIDRKMAKDLEINNRFTNIALRYEMAH